VIGWFFGIQTCT